MILDMITTVYIQNQSVSCFKNSLFLHWYLTVENILAFSNSTCLPEVGMFILNSSLTNYSTAYLMCRNLGGSLAHVMSEKRSRSLANLLKSQLNLTAVQEAYVGLNETTVEKFYTSANESYDCLLYRAWAPRHPAYVNKFIFYF